MEEKSKQTRVGKFTFGIILILSGIMIFIQTVCNLDILRYVLMLWPLVLICLGIEILVYANKENVKYDFLGGIFTLIIIAIVLCFSIANYGVNKILYNEEFQETVKEYIEKQGV